MREKGLETRLESAVAQCTLAMQTRAYDERACVFGRNLPLVQRRRVVSLVELPLNAIFNCTSKALLSVDLASMCSY